MIEEGIVRWVLVTILENLYDLEAATRDPDLFTEYARHGVQRAILCKDCMLGEVTNVVTVDPAM